MIDHEECASREQREHGEKSQVGNNQVREHTKKLQIYILDLKFNEMQRVRCDYSISLFQDAS
jgi:hypothetical protein